MKIEQNKTAAAEATAKEPKIRIFELIDTQPSSYRLEGTDDVFLCAPAKRVLLSTSVEVDKEGNFVRLRYIKGCKHLEVEKQNELKIAPNLSTGADVIIAENGKVIIVEDADGKIMADYLSRIVLNESKAHLKQGVTPIYREVIKEIEAQKTIDNFFIERRAMDVINTLLIQDGKKTKFNEGKIDKLCLFFNLTGFESGAYKEKVEALIQYSKYDPEAFVNSIVDETSSVKATVLLAVSLNVANFVDGRFIIENGSKVICKVESKEREDQLAEVVEHLTKSESHEDLQTLILEIDLTRKGK